MSLVKIEGNASGTGTFTIAAPNSNTNRTLTLPDATGTIITTAGGAAISGTTGTFSGTISGGSTVGVGGATPSASGAGITFPATQSASSNANTLDDYEEGTWTPTMFGSTSAGTTTYTHQDGVYVKIGRVVYVQADVRWTNATGTGNLRIGGFPFTAKDISSNLNIGTNNIALTANNLATWLQMVINDTQAQTYQMPTGGGGFNDVPIDTAGGMWINGFYYTNT